MKAAKNYQRLTKMPRHLFEKSKLLWQKVRAQTLSGLLQKLNAAAATFTRFAIGLLDILSYIASCILLSVSTTVCFTLVSH